MRKFSEGCSAIDTTRNRAVTIGGIIASPCGDLYVVKGWRDDDKYYILHEDDLIEYDKYYFNEV